jgi:hypothetical protein
MSDKEVDGEEEPHFCALKCFREHSKQFRCQEKGEELFREVCRTAGGTLCEKCGSKCLIYCDCFLEVKIVRIEILQPT